jgi:hypothetical protein
MVTSLPARKWVALQHRHSGSEDEAVQLGASSASSVCQERGAVTSREADVFAVSRKFPAFAQRNQWAADHGGA